MTERDQVLALVRQCEREIFLPLEPGEREELVDVLLEIGMPGLSGEQLLEGIGRWAAAHDDAHAR